MQARSLSLSSEFGAHIAAVPFHGQDSPRAECRNCTENQRLRKKCEMVGDLQYHG
jgi:hypothetical protein